MASVCPMFINFSYCLLSIQDVDNEGTMNDNDGDASAMEVEYVANNDHHKDSNTESESIGTVSDDCGSSLDDVDKDSHSKKTD